MSTSGEYYSYYMAHDYLAHHGVLGMKWGQHIFGKDKKTRGTRKAEKAKKPLFETKKQLLEREKQDRIAQDRKLNAQAKKRHEKEKVRRSKLSKKQALDELSFMDRIVTDTYSDQDWKKYAQLVDEVARSVYDRTNWHASSEAGKKLNEIHIKQVKLKDKSLTAPDDEFDKILKQERQLDEQYKRILTKEMGYKCYPEVMDQLAYIDDSY